MRIDDDALLRVWENSRERLRTHLARSIGRGAPLDDLMQDLFVKVYPHAARLQPEWAAAYLQRAAANLANDYHRRRLREYRYPVGDPDELVSAAADPEERYARREREALYRDRVLPAIDGLDPRKVEAIDAFLADEPRERVAREIGVNPSTLRSRQISAFDELRRRLSDYAPGRANQYGR